MIYAYGMCVWSTIHRLEGRIPGGDGYGEVAESWSVPAGEATNAAILLRHWGQRVRLDGATLGTATRGPLLEALNRHGVDVSALRYDPEFEGFWDLVLTDARSRTVFGRFGHHLRSLPKPWSPPDRAAVAGARVVLVDSCFGDDSRLAAEYCRQEGKPLVVVDCRHDDPLHAHAAATVLSREFLQREYAAANLDSLLAEYSACSRGLTIVTQGTDPVHFARQGTAPRLAQVIPVQARITIGAGDTFRAGIAHGVLQGWPDERTVEFAIDAAAAVCSTGPVAVTPPSLAQIAQLRDRRRAASPI
jgi:sugar/nucleoside kinase (ribokinase family)